MKKRILALSLVLALLAVMVPTTFAATLTKTKYLDMNFDNGGLTNAAEGGSIAWNHVKWSAMSFENEPIRNNTAMRMVNNHAAEGGLNGRAATQSFTLDEGDVIWYEFSFMQQNAPMGIQMQTGLTGISLAPSGIATLGHLATSYPKATVNTLSFELDTWYHVAFAIDQVDRASDSNGQAPKMYLWVNGRLVDNGQGYTALQDSRSVGSGIGDQNLLFIILANTADTANSGVMYVDNVKCYTTNQAVKDENDTYNYYDPEEIFGSANLEAASYMTEGDTIYVPESATLGDVLDSDMTYEGIITCLDGAERVTDMSRQAASLTLYVAAEDSLIGRSYHLVSNKIKTQYYDLNFDDGSLANAAGNLAYGYTGSSFTASQSFVADSIRGNKAMKLDFAANQLYFQGTPPGMSALNLTNRTMWYELSFMAEKAMPSLEIRSQGRAFKVFEDGSFTTGGACISALPSAKVIDPANPAQELHLNTGEWYHVVVAIDNIDKVNNVTKLYTWINGELMHEGTTLNEAYTGLSSVHLQSQRVSTSAIQIFAQSSKESTLYLDNYKVYSTISSVADYDYNAAEIYADTAVPGSSYSVVNGTIYAPANTTLAEVKGSFVGGEVAESDQALYALTQDKAYAKKYTLVTLEGEYLFAPGTVRLERENGTTLLPSAISSGTKLRLSGVLANFTGESKNGVLVLAAYNDGKLASCVLTPITAGGKVTTDVLTIENAENLTLRAFLWDSVSGMRPAMSAIY